MPYEPKTNIDFKEEIFGIVNKSTSDHSDEKTKDTIPQKPIVEYSDVVNDTQNHNLNDAHSVIKPNNTSAQKSTMDIIKDKHALHRQHYSFPGYIKDWLIDSVSILKKKRLKGVSESGLLQALIANAIKINLDIEQIYLEYINKQT